MKNNVLEGKWNEIKGQVKQKWGKLTDNDLLEIKGNVQKLSGKLQKQYGYQENEAKREIDNFIKDIDRENKYKY